MKKNPSYLSDKRMMLRAVGDAFAKLDPRVQIKNPVMFLVYGSAILTSLLFVCALFGVKDAGLSAGFILAIAVILWFTCLFANFAEAIAEGRGKAQADALRAAKRDVEAHKIPSVNEKEKITTVASALLKKGDVVIVKAGEQIPADGEVVEGVASVDESAITGESAPVIRESGGDRSAVTGGTTVVSDWLVVKVTCDTGESFLDKMIAMVEGASRKKTPNEIALQILLVALTIIFLLVTVSLYAFSDFDAKQYFMANPSSVTALVALLVCLAPTTIGALLSAIGIAGMSRLNQANVLAMSGRAIEAAGDVDVLLLDKTGTITLGNRQASQFYPMDGVTPEQMADAAQLSSLADETPEGRSIVVLAKEQFGLRGRDMENMHAEFVPFTAKTRMSGVNLPGGVEIRKGAAEAIRAYVVNQHGTYPDACDRLVRGIAEKGGTPLVVAKNARVLGVIELKDIIKQGVKEKFADLRKMGIKTIMITGDNPLTAAAIAAEAGVDDFLAEATPEGKLEMIRDFQRKGHLVAMTGDGTNDAPALAQADVAVYGDDVPVQIAEYAKVSGVTKIVLGRTNTRAVLFGRRKSFVEQLNERTPDIDVYIIPGADTEKKYRAGGARRVKDVPLNLRSAGVALLIFVLSTALSVVSKSMGFNDAFVITLYVFGILLTAVTTGNRLLGLIMAVVSVLTYNYFFTEPYLTFRVSDPGYGMAFLLMLLVSIVSGSMARRVRRQARQEAEKAHRTEILLRASQKFQRITDERELLEELGSELVALLGRSVTIYSAGTVLGDPLFFPAQDDPRDEAFYTTPDEYAVAAWVFKNHKHAGATTGTLPGAKCLYLAARSQDAVQAVVGVSLADGGTLGSFERNLLLTLLDVVSLAIERIRLTRTKNQAQREAEQAEFQANLLRMISHDLRTPLTSISGNAELLLREDGKLDGAKRRRLYDDIERDSQWLEELVENLLAMTRVENDATALKLQPEMVGDVIEEAVSHTQSRLKGRSLKIEQEDEYLMARMDAHLIVQVIVNLIDNAVKYTPPGTEICLRGYSEGRQACIEVSDQGPGVPDAEKEKLFGMFYTANNVHGDGRRGIGLGLALCRTIANAHGGSISVRDNVPHGCVFCLRLQKENNPDMQTGGTEL